MVKDVTERLVDGSLEVSILLWNVWNLPSWLTDNKSRTRALQISPLLNDYDVVVLNEAFVNHKALLESVTHEFRYIPARPWSCLFSSGLIFLSRYKIVGHHYEKFDQRSGVDRFAGKGVAYIDISLDFAESDYGQLRILGTHMQASYGDSAQACRMAQAHQIAKTIGQTSSGMSQHDSVPALRTVLVGDMNIGPQSDERITYSQHYFDDADAIGRISAYANLMERCSLMDVTRFTEPDRDRHEYSNEICRLLVSKDLQTSEMSYALQAYTDGGNRLSDTKALCLTLRLNPVATRSSEL